METELEFPCGECLLTARIPAKNVACVLNRRETEGLPDEGKAILRSLRQPVESPPLRDCLRPVDKIVVIVTDNTRPCPDDRILPPLLAELEAVVPRRNITIMVAVGLHSPLDEAGLIRKLGREIVENYRVLNHDVNRTVYIGTTSRGTPVDINKEVVEADFRISTGFIEPHFFAGFSGGRKSIAPGVFSVRSAYSNHGYQMIEHPLARAGVLKGNPVHEDLVEQAQMARLNFIVNVLLNRNREITHVVAGHPVKAHEKGCRMEKTVAGVRVKGRVDMAVTTNSGAPLDLDLYQTCKGIDTASQITRDGGIIIIASSCSTGIGPQSFLEVHASAGSPKEVLRKIRREEPVGVQWQNQILARAQLKQDIYLVSELEDETVCAMMMTPVNTIEEGLEKAFHVLGPDGKIGVIPEGPLVLPLLEG